MVTILRTGGTSTIPKQMFFGLGYFIQIYQYLIFMLDYKGIRMMFLCRKTGSVVASLNSGYWVTVPNFSLG
jgi:hypothetical protein